MTTAVMMLTGTGCEGWGGGGGQCWGTGCRIWKGDGTGRFQRNWRGDCRSKGLRCYGDPELIASSLRDFQHRYLHNVRTVERTLTVLCN